MKNVCVRFFFCHLRIVKIREHVVPECNFQPSPIFTSQEEEHVRVELPVVSQPNLTKLWLPAATSDIFGQGRRNDKVLNRERIRLG